MPKRGKSPLMRFLLQFNNPLVIIRLAASAIMAVLKNPTDALVIFGLALLNAVIRYSYPFYRQR
jgi:cation-transporting ATPase F